MSFASGLGNELGAKEHGASERTISPQASHVQIFLPGPKSVSRAKRETCKPSLRRLVCRYISFGSILGNVVVVVTLRGTWLRTLHQAHGSCKSSAAANVLIPVHSHASHLSRTRHLTPASSPGWSTAHPPPRSTSQSCRVQHHTPYPSPPPQTPPGHPRPGPTRR